MDTSLIPATLLIVGAIVLFVLMSLLSLFAPGEPEHQDFTPNAP